jgi:hypothetical protein
MGLILLVVVMVGLSLVSRSGGGPREPATASQLRHVATQFNLDYQRNDDAPVWERFDAASQAVITKARYVRWHQECRTAPGPATILDVSPSSSDWWVVAYEISGVTLHDYWHQQDGRWRFSLARSNPSAVSLYSSTYSAYAQAMGCALASG